MKIDKCFIDDLLSEDLDKVITGDIISMAQKLGHCTVAEGVENDVQLQYLIEYGCDKVQGYLISKPIDEEEVLDFLRSGRKRLFLKRQGAALCSRISADDLSS